MTPIFSLIANDPFDLSQPPGGADTIHVYDSYTLADGDTLDLNGSPGFKLGVGHNSVSLDIAGTVALDSGNHQKLIGIVTSNSINGQAAVQIDKTGSLSLSTDASGASAIGIGILSANSSAANAGLLDISAPAGNAAGMVAEAASVTMTNSGTIKVAGLEDAFGMVSELAGTGSLTNSGTITVSGTVVLGMAGIATTSVSTDNSGHIHATSNTSVAGSFVVGMAAENVGGTSSNEGDIIVSGGAETVGVELLNVASFTNTGHIIVEDPGALTAGLLFVSIAGGAIYTNDGLIRGPLAVASADGLLGLGGGSPEADNLVNNGRIVGMIAVGGGDDSVVNTGRIVGDVSMGDDSDTFDGSHGRMEGAVSGGLGGDSLIGSSGADLIYGDQQDNSLGGGDDVIRGLKGDDHLIGGVGNDTLSGGAGADTLKGGDGADVFKFDRVADSAGAKVDLIADLSNSDTIQLSAIDADINTGGDQAFHLVASFSGAAGELTVSYNAGTGLTTIAGDTNGDGVADLVITASGDHHNFTNFVL